MNDWRLSSGPLRAFLINLGYFTLFASTILVPAILCFVFNPLEFGDIGPATVRLHNRTNVRVKVFENNQWGPTPDDIRAAEIAELDPGESKETGWVFPLKPSYRVED